MWLSTAPGSACSSSAATAARSASRRVPSGGNGHITTRTSPYIRSLIIAAYKFYKFYKSYKIYKIYKSSAPL
ncbi:MAG: hypothetical protein K2F72_07870, partial [Muribaculaceae bacterium]|nr:hypothetical protein [Muribaculaceae bacterium]